MAINTYTTQVIQSKSICELSKVETYTLGVGEVISVSSSHSVYRGHCFFIQVH